MKKILPMLILSCVMLLSACEPTRQEQSPISLHVIYLTFEEALTYATDVVIAQYVGSRPFGEHMTEFEFAVLDRVFGNAPDRIFVYADSSIAKVMGGERAISYNLAGLNFTQGTNYLLALECISLPLTRKHDDAFLFIGNIVVDLDNPHNSTMYNEPLFYHSAELNFRSRSFSSEQIVPFVRELTKNNTPARGFIRSEYIGDVLSGSPYVLLVEINERWTLFDGLNLPERTTDLYRVTVIQSLKGEIDAGYELLVGFLVGSVQTGEQHIIASEPADVGSYLHSLTSRNSVFGVYQLDEIMSILNP